MASLEVLTRKELFGGHPPARLPEDVTPPDFKRLIDRADVIDPSTYPPSNLLAILAHENRNIGASSDDWTMR